MDGDVYKEVLEEILIQWIKENFGIKNVLFRHDMATCHFRGDATAHMKSVGLEFVEWKDNAPKLPQSRPIERYRAPCKREYARSGEKPATLSESEARWTEISK